MYTKPAALLEAATNPLCCFFQEEDSLHSSFLYQTKKGGNQIIARGFRGQQTGNEGQESTQGQEAGESYKVCVSLSPSAIELSNMSQAHNPGLKFVDFWWAVILCSVVSCHMKGTATNECQIVWSVTICSLSMWFLNA